MRDEVYSVHATRPDDTGAVEIVFRTEREAIAYAKDRSTDWRVLAASVTRFTIGELGTRHPVAWFVDGEQQSPRAARPGGRFYPTDGSRCRANAWSEQHVTAGATTLLYCSP